MEALSVLFITGSDGSRVFVSIWYALGTMIVAAILAFGLHAVLVRLVVRWSGRTANNVDDIVVERLRSPTRWLMPLLAVMALVRFVPVEDLFVETLRHTVLVLIILACGRIAFASILAAQAAVDRHVATDSKDDLRARAIQTQMRGIRNIGGFVIAVLTSAFVLTTFEPVRQFGVSLLASAGIAGVVLGFAAQKSLSTVLAGIQIAFTQPIRVGDAVVVENEWGWIEEIKLTFVVVRIWDLRRLVLPITYFIERPFQNWTKTSSEILGTVMLSVDYTVPVDAVRAELDRILASTQLWDGKVKNLQVTEAKRDSIELRALMSAADGGAAWDLRCLVRERLIAFLQRDYPWSLPRVRVRLEPDAGPLQPSPPS